MRTRPVMFIESDCVYTDKRALIKLIQSMRYVIEQRSVNVLCMPV
jgi:hypothetical protein